MITMDMTQAVTKSSERADKMTGLLMRNRLRTVRLVHPMGIVVKRFFVGAGCQTTVLPAGNRSLDKGVGK